MLNNEQLGRYVYGKIILNIRDNSKNKQNGLLTPRLGPERICGVPGNIPEKLTLRLYRGTASVNF